MFLANHLMVKGSIYLNCTASDPCRYLNCSSTRNEDCIISCDGRESCGNAYIDCSTSNNCIIECNGNKPCQNTTINAKMAYNLSLTLATGGINPCALNSNIYCPVDWSVDKNCKIICAGPNIVSCNEFKIYAVEGSYVNVIFDTD